LSRSISTALPSAFSTNSAQNSARSEESQSARQNEAKDYVAHIPALERNKCKDFQTVFEITGAIMEFFSNSMLIMRAPPASQQRLHSSPQLW
jgi:hypothetical protein